MMVAVAVALAGCGTSLPTGGAGGAPVVVRCPVAIDVLPECRPCADYVSLSPDPTIESILSAYVGLSKDYEDCRTASEACRLSMEITQTAWNECGEG